MLKNSSFSREMGHIREKLLSSVHLIKYMTTLVYLNWKKILGNGLDIGLVSSGNILYLNSCVFGCNVFFFNLGRYVVVPSSGLGSEVGWLGGPIDGSGGISSTSAGLLSRCFVPSCLDTRIPCPEFNSSGLMDLRLPLTWITGVGNVISVWDHSRVLCCVVRVHGLLRDQLSTDPGFESS